MSQSRSVELCRLHWESSRCSNCLSCVVVCSERHTGTSDPSRSLIRIRLGLFDGAQSAEYCRQCGDAPCAAACAVEAIVLDAERGFWRVDDAQCIACGECVDACPYHAIHLDVVSGVAAKCDLCLGAARCVEICPTQALVLECSREV